MYRRWMLSIVAGLGIVSLAIPLCAVGGTIDPALLSKFSPGQQVPAILWLEDQPGYEISQRIRERYRDQMEALTLELLSLVRSRNSRSRWSKGEAFRSR